METEDIVGIAGIVLAAGFGAATGFTAELPEYMTQVQPANEALAHIYLAVCRTGIGAAMTACTLVPLGLGLAYLNGLSQEGSE